MNLDISINSVASKLTVIAVTLGISTVLVFSGVWYLALGTLTDDRVTIPAPVLNAWVKYLPNSPRLHARIAASEMEGVERDLGRAESHIRRAISLMPGEYSYHIMLASILEAQGDRERAEVSCREAVQLAPSYLETHWRLANNLVRQGKVAESLEHFRYATSRNLALLPNAFDLIWNVSGGNQASINAITSPGAKAQLILSGFLVKQAKFVEAAAIYRQVEREKRRTESEGVTIINGLIAANQMALARELWSETMSENSGKPALPLWNGSFESAINPESGQFDWSLKDNQYVRVVIDPQNGKTGQSSLRLTFLGKDTAKLTDEIRQIVLLKPGKRYSLDFQYKTKDLSTPAGPQVAVVDAATGTLIGGSEPLPEGSQDWKGVSFSFAASAQTAWIRIQRIPKYSYDDPSRGVIWFDDFVLREQ